MTRAPIALFVYSRPRHTRRTVEALQRNSQASESDLWVYSDAARNPNGSEGVQQVRDYIKTIDGFKTVTVVEHTENRGLAGSIVAGLGEICAKYGRAIVMEDDLECSQYFLEYMNAALERYAHDDRVMQIAGHMFAVDLKMGDDALFLPFITSWGWATWERAWQHFDFLATGYDRLAADPALRRRFDLDGHYNYFKMLKAQQEGKIDSWAIRWYLSVFRREGLALYPKKSFIRNLGFDGSGVNCNVSDFTQSDLDPSFHARCLPSKIEVSPEFARVCRALPVPRVNLGSMFARAKRFIGRGN